ncbi:reverse transcriptase domain-containing protein [Tanacetum coccineum]
MHDFKALLKDEYCLNNEMQRLENDHWNHTMVGAGHAAYTDQLHKLAKLVPHLVTPESKRIERYIYGIVLEIRRMMQATKPSIIKSAIFKAGVLTNDVVRNGLLKKGGEKRRDGGEPSKQMGTMVDNKKSKAPGQVPNNSNQVLEIGGKNPNRRNNGNPARGRAFVMGTNEAGRSEHCDGTRYRHFELTIAKPLTLLTQKDKKFKWDENQDGPFQTMKDELCDALILALPEGPDDFVVYYVASNQGFGCVLMQRGKVIAYTSRQFKIHRITTLLTT